MCGVLWLIFFCDFFLCITVECCHSLLESRCSYFNEESKISFKCVVDVHAVLQFNLLHLQLLFFWDKTLQIQSGKSLKGFETVSNTVCPSDEVF